MGVDAVRARLRRLRWAVPDTGQSEETEVEGRPTHVVTDDEGAVEVTRGTWAALERFRRIPRG